MKKKLLIIHQTQFGYHTDTYYYCKYLQKEYRITYLCWHYNKPIIKINNIHIKYVFRDQNIILRNIRFIKAALLEASKEYDYIFIVYFRGCSILSLIGKKASFVLDIRTGSVNKSYFRRVIFNSLICLESKFYRNITVISESLRKKLKLPSVCHVLPLGADILTNVSKRFYRMDLLYVGTLNNRNIDHTLVGFAKFNQRFHSRISLTYTIVGDGKNNEKNKLIDLVRKLGLNDSVKIEGYIPHDKIKKYFEINNIGVTYIPMTKYFDVQPPTKTFEYLLSGMAVIGTKTFEHTLIINKANGILVNDNPESFYKGLVEIKNNLGIYESEKIRSQSAAYTWQNVLHNFKYYLDGLAENN